MKNMTQESINLIISSTHSWIENDGEKVNIFEVIQSASKVGLIPQESVATVPVLNYINSLSMNPNSTFYKTWEDVTSKNRFELFVDQMCHYASTYGTNFEGESWVPNDIPVDLVYTDYTVIKSVTRKEMFDTLTSMIYSGVALKSELISAICECLEYLSEFTIDINKVKNNEALCLIAQRFHLFPINGPLATRVVYNMLSGKTQIVQSKNMYSDLAGDMYHNLAIVKKTFENFDEDTCVILAQSYLRYKRFWKAARRFCKAHNINDGVIAINRISNIAKRYHKPISTDFWSDISTHYFTEKELDYQISKLDNPYKIVKILEMILLRQYQDRNYIKRMFNIRNGNVWFDDQKKKVRKLDGKFNIVKDKLIDRLVGGLAMARINSNPDGLTLIKFPKDVELVMPSSQKTFYGNYPFGSSMNIGKNSFIGVYWENEWGTNDFDLSFIASTGRKYGWDGAYCDDVIYSGDMTSAPHGASEIIQFTDKVTDGVVYLNRYNGAKLSKYMTFVGTGDNKQSEYANKITTMLGKGAAWMVNPDDIISKEMGVSYKRQQISGVVHNGKFYFMTFNHVDSCVSDSAEIYSSMVAKTVSHVPMDMVFKAAGYVTEVTEENKELITKTIDLTDVSLDKIVELMKF